MALIKEIRQRTGLAIGVIAVGLIFFLVGGDLLGPNSMLLGSSRTTVGEIAGEDVLRMSFPVSEIKHGRRLLWRKFLPNNMKS